MNTSESSRVNWAGQDADPIQVAIGFDIDRGEEDLARGRYGDAAVDRYFAGELGITVEQLRDGTLDGINGYGP